MVTTGIRLEKTNSQIRPGAHLQLISYNLGNIFLEALFYIKCVFMHLNTLIYQIFRLYD